MTNTEDSQAAAYGEFHLAFAALETELTRSLVLLNRADDFRAEFDKTKWQGFSKKVKRLRASVTLFADRGMMEDSVSAVGNALDEAERVSKWRNDRIHGEVWFVDGRFVLLGKDGTPLAINVDGCSTMRSNAILALCEIQAHISQFVNALEFDEAADALFKKLNAEMEQSHSGGEDIVG